MWKQVLSIFAAGLVMATGAAQAARIEFQGSMKITSTSGCQTSFDPTGNIYTATYWLPIAGSDNDNRSTISIFSQTGAESFSVDPGRFTTTLKAAQGNHIATLPGDYPIKIRVATQSPAIPTATTKTIRLTGTVQGFDFRPTCTINFDMFVFKRK